MPLIDKYISAYDIKIKTKHGGVDFYMAHLFTMSG